MKSKILMMAAALTMVGSLSVAPMAQAGFHGGGFHSGGHYGGWHSGYGHYYGGFGWGLAGGLAAGALLSYPYYGYPYYGYGGYYEPAYVNSGSVTVYDDSPAQTQATPTSSAPPVWYYCQSPKGYYPYVPSCPSGWQQVPATPPH